MSLLSAEAREAAEIFDRSGKNALSEYLDSLRQRESILVYFFDEQANPLLRQEGPSNFKEVASIVREAAKAAVEDSPVASGEPGVAAKQVAGPSGRRHTLVLQFQRGPISPLWTIFERYPLLRVAVIFLVGGLLCLSLTRHITEPLVRLRGAASSIAAGRFETRVGQTFGRRRDEIATLGRDFDRMAEQIESLITAQRRLLGDVSHELRSPLSRLIVALTLLRKSSPEEAPEYLDRIGIEAERLDTLIGQLLTLARIESGVDASLRGRFDLTNLVHEVAADGDFEGRAQNRSVKVLAAEACTMSGLVELLRSAIENVVRNAIHYTSAGTAVEITLQKRDEANGSKALLRVRDYGSGVPPEMLPEIFLPFRRATGRSEIEVNGAGLGLAITERVVRMHDGTVRAANAADGGLVVEIELPLNS
jgi:two-component system sensor histidine kinase CpxA